MLTAILLFLFSTASSQQPAVWHTGCDTSQTVVYSDSIPFTREYTLFSVLYNRIPDSCAHGVDTPSLLWSITENDTLLDGVCGSAHVTRSGVATTVDAADDDGRPLKNGFTDWCVYMHHQGLRMDSLLPHRLIFGAACDTVPSYVRVAEYIWFPSFLRRDRQAMYASALAMKYGITLDNAPYVSFAGDTLWSYPGNAAYYHRIVAAGRDSLVFCRNISRSFQGAPVTLSVADSTRYGHVLCGDDDASLEWRTLPLLQEDDTLVLSRTWRLRSSFAACGISVNAAMFGADTVRLAVIDAYGNILRTLSPDSLASDGSCCFSLSLTDKAAEKGELPLVCHFTFLASRSSLLTHQRRMRSSASDSGSHNSSFCNHQSPIALRAINQNSSPFPDTWRIYDAAGRLVLTLPYNDATPSLPAAGLPSGVYQAEACAGGNTVETLKIVIN